MLVQLHAYSLNTDLTACSSKQLLTLETVIDKASGVHYKTLFGFKISSRHQVNVKSCIALLITVLNWNTFLMFKHSL